MKNKKYNDEGAHFYFRNIVESIREQEEKGELEEGELENKIYDLSYRLSSFIDEHFPESCKGFYSDLLTYALEQVDYYELAESMLKDF